MITPAGTSPLAPKPDGKTAEVYSMIDKLSNLAASKVLGESGNEALRLVTTLQHNVKELKSIDVDVLKALKAALKGLQQQIPPGSLHELEAGISALQTSIKSTLPRTVTIRTRDNFETKIDPEVLSSRSGFFKALFGSQFREGRESFAKLNESAKTLNELYLFCKLDKNALPGYLDHKNATKYLMLAAKYDIPHLRNAAANALIRHLEASSLETIFTTLEEIAPQELAPVYKWMSDHINSNTLFTISLIAKKAHNQPLLDACTKWAALKMQVMSPEELAEFREKASASNAMEIVSWCDYESKARGYYQISGQQIQIAIGGLLGACIFDDKAKEILKDVLSFKTNTALSESYIALGPVNGLIAPFLKLLPEHVTGLECILNPRAAPLLSDVFDRCQELKSLTFYARSEPDARELHLLSPSFAKLKNLSELTINLSELPPNSEEDIAADETKDRLTPILRDTGNTSITKLSIQYFSAVTVDKFATELKKFDKLTGLDIYLGNMSSTYPSLLKAFASMPNLREVTHSGSRRNFLEQFSQEIVAMQAERAAKGYPPLMIE